MFNDIWSGRQSHGAIEVTGICLLCLGYLLLVFGDVLDWEHIKDEGKSIRGNSKRIWKKAEKVADRQMGRQFDVATTEGARVARPSIFELDEYLPSRRVPDPPKENFSQLPVPGKFRRIVSTVVGPNVNDLQNKTGS